ALPGAVELAEEDPLPRAERERPVPDRHEHARAHEGGADVRRRVLLALLDVLPGPVLRNDPLQRDLKVARHRGIRVLVYRHPRGRVRALAEGRAAGTVELAERRTHELRDVDELTSFLGRDTELPHGAYPRQP